MKINLYKIINVLHVSLFFKTEWLLFMLCYLDTAAVSDTHVMTADTSHAIKKMETMHHCSEEEN